MKALPWRLRDRSTGDVAEQSVTPIAAAAARTVEWEPWLAPVCALVLLLAPNPLVWPAAIVGMLPTVARLVLTGRPWRATPFDLPLLLLALGGLLGGYASLSREGAVIRLTGLLAAFILFAALREHVSGERALRRLVVGGLIASVVSSLLLLVLVGPFLLLERLPLLADLVAAVDPGHLRDWFVDQDWLLQRYRFRASGVGALADVGLALAVAALVGLRGRAPSLLVVLSVPIFLVLLLVADNRGSMLAGALTLGAMATVWRRKLLPLVPVVAVLGLLVIAFGPVDRGLSMKTLAQRFWFWENSLYLAREVPLTGAGLGLESVQLVYRAYFQPSYPPFSHAHNIYLQGLLEYGIFGLLGLVGLGLATLWAGWRTLGGADRWTMAGRLAGFGAAMAMLTTGLTEIVLLSTLGGVLAIAALGLLAATTGEAPPACHGAPESPRPPGPLPIAMERDVGAGPERACEPKDVRAARRPGGGAFPRLAIPIIGIVVVIAGLAFTGLGASIGARLLLNLGTAELNRGSLSESIERDDRASSLDRATSLLRTASTLNPDDVTVQRNLALALAANDDARRARAVADRAKALTSPANKADLFQLGRAYIAISAWGEAIRAWQAADASQQLIQLGNKLIRARNYDQAINAFTATARVDPRSRGAFDGIARAAHERKSTVDETIEEFEPLLAEGSPSEYGARLQVARELRAAGRFRDAGVQLTRAEEIDATPELSFEYGMLWMGVGMPYFAEPLLIRPAADIPLDQDNWLWLARSHADAGHDEQAVEAIREGLSKLDPSGEFAPPAERLPETAAVRAAEIKRSERAPLLGVMAESLIRLGRVDEALPALDEAVAAQPKDAWLAAVRAEAQRVQAGATPNLLLNPSFARDGTWALRPTNWLEYVTIPTLVNAAPTLANGRAEITAASAANGALTQEVFGLQATAPYRLDLRLRTEALGSGTVVVSLIPSSGEPVRHEIRGEEAAQGITVTLEAEPGPPPSSRPINRTASTPTSSLAVSIALVADPSSGAVVWCDEATLVPADRAR